MSDASLSGWRATGLIWSARHPVLEWSGPGGATRTSPLPAGADLAFACGPNRLCIGVWRSGARRACPIAERIAAGARSAQCPACQALDRSSSIATDTRLTDPRPFCVYLAHHGSTIKVGITAAERGDARLLEQGALASTILSTGTLLSGRRTEILITTALGLPDRVSSSRKRDARARPGSAGERAAELLAAAARTRQLAGWPAEQRQHPLQVSDHTEAYHLPPGGLHPVAALAALEPAAVVSGRTVCRIGTDLYLDAAPGLLLIDTRLLAGWALGRAAPGAAFTAALHPLDPRQAHDQDALF
ncbi:DUF2797 domain-containing protein [Streptacidiphilus sp. EB103A]|uniref:DUF2797 domain-containing protein n=1 Tax=Streptacidiphilus sp. EB103A TaxID=3156275 RepID=UPI00351891C0